VKTKRQITLTDRNSTVPTLFAARTPPLFPEHFRFWDNWGESNRTILTSFFGHTTSPEKLGRQTIEKLPSSLAHAGRYARRLFSHCAMLLTNESGMILQAGRHGSYASLIAAYPRWLKTP